MSLEMRVRIPLTVPLLRRDVTPVLADREDVFHQEAAVVFSICRAAVRTLQHFHHVFHQLAALQTGPSWETMRGDVLKMTRNDDNNNGSLRKSLRLFA